MTTSEGTYDPVFSNNFMIEGRNRYEISIKWKIEHFSTIKADKRRISPKFRCADAVWNLHVYPNGQRSLHNVGYVLMYLNKIHSPTDEHSTIFKFDVIDKQQNEVYDMLPMEMECKGNGRKWLFCTIERDDILKSGILSHDTLTVSFDLTIVQNADSVAPLTGESNKGDIEMQEKCKHCLKPVTAIFESLYSSGRFSDVTLKVGKFSFDAHKVVLGCRSRVFAAMFEQDMWKNRNSTIEINEVDDGIVDLMLKYIYCGDIPQLSPDVATDLYVMANRYELQELLITCRRVMFESISMNNICDIAIVADLHEDKELTDAVKCFLKINTKQLLETKKWKLFSKLKPDLSVKLLESVILNK